MGRRRGHENSDHSGTCGGRPCPGLFRGRPLAGVRRLGLPRQGLGRGYGRSEKRFPKRGRLAPLGGFLPRQRDAGGHWQRRGGTALATFDRRFAPGDHRPGAADQFRRGAARRPNDRRVRGRRDRAAVGLDDLAAAREDLAPLPARRLRQYGGFQPGRTTPGHGQPRRHRVRLPPGASGKPLLAGTGTRLHHAYRGPTIQGTCRNCDPGGPFATATATSPPGRTGTSFSGTPGRGTKSAASRATPTGSSP